MKSDLCVAFEERNRKGKSHENKSNTIIAQRRMFKEKRKETVCLNGKNDHHSKYSLFVHSKNKKGSEKI